MNDSDVGRREASDVGGRQLNNDEIAALQVDHLTSHGCKELKLDQLYKNIGKIEHVYDFLDGILYCNTVEHFKKGEDVAEGSIVDEGSLARRKSQGLDDVNIFCLHTHWHLTDWRGNEWSASQTGLPWGVGAFSQRWFARGKYLVVIRHHREFLRRVHQAVQRSEARTMLWGPVRYQCIHQPTITHREAARAAADQAGGTMVYLRNAFIKRSSFAWEQELRILIEAGDMAREKNGAIRLQVRDMRDIVTVLERNSDDLFNWTVWTDEQVARASVTFRPREGNGSTTITSSRRTGSR